MGSTVKDLKSKKINEATGQWLLGRKWGPSITPHFPNTNTSPYKDTQKHENSNCMDAVPEELQTQVQDLEEESSWEVFQEDEFSGQSEEGSDEDSGDEVLRYWSAKHKAVS